MEIEALGEWAATVICSKTSGKSASWRRTEYIVGVVTGFVCNTNALNPAPKVTKAAYAGKADNRSLKSWYTGGQTFQSVSHRRELRNRVNPFICQALPVTILVSLHFLMARDFRMVLSIHDSFFFQTALFRDTSVDAEGDRYQFVHCGDVVNFDIADLLGF
jgi:hypothetical protein